MIAIIGGVKGIEFEYKGLMKKNNLKCKIYNQNCPNFEKKIKNCEACIMFTNTVSHKLSISCNKVCKKNDIKLIRVHSSSINKLKESISEVCEYLEE
ncbi:MAG: DUF2325 domain-containing protein [Psychrilyobacter sp.]|uniref:DUF2325 domain-containing protein n=1 Tax=Psychrilyobacter sp. TaxID=2586924 RepID=UPI003C77382B